MKRYEGKVNTSFHDDEMPREGSCCICASVLLIHSVFKIGKTIIYKCFWKNVNTLSRKQKIDKYISDDLKVSSHDSDREDSNEKASVKENNA